MFTQDSKDSEQTKGRWVAVWTLVQFWKRKTFLAKYLHSEFRKNRVPPIDRPFVTELVQGTVRWHLYLDWILRQFVHNQYDKLPDVIHAILQISLYQKLFLTKIPDYAIVNEAIKLTRQGHQEKLVGFVNGVLRNVLRNVDEIDYPDEREDPVQALSVLFSFPEWMVRRWTERYGVEFTRSLLEALNRPPATSVRVNTLKITPEDYFEILQDEGFHPQFGLYLREFLLVHKSRWVEKFPFYHEGNFSIQDESAGLVAHVLDPQPGETILDMCSAPGGKTTHIAELMRNQGRVIAVDLYAHRLQVVEENAKRLGLDCITSLVADGLTLSLEPVDRVLVDAPCSGLGVIAKKPEIKWRRTPRDIREMADLQSGLLENAARLVKKGGILVYSTCTIEPEENDHQIEKFLENHKDFVLEPPDAFVGEKVTDSGKWVKTFPHIHGVDGSFVARLKRI
ncbi:MAG: 16S rRNA (cytosine(967)-C(5))-methyltransferase RsmB [Calditrichaeota bacterium]|nr:16S rRNA (cytosine(967)-C(5))-methyltransferase RsmB [Calditrichota bacterium]